MTKPLNLPTIEYEDEVWQSYALCRHEGVPTDWFYADLDTKQYAHDEEVMEVCWRCPVRSECTDYALRENEQFGIWGGMYEDERLKLRKRRAAAWDKLFADISPDVSSVARSLVDAEEV